MPYAFFACLFCRGAVDCDETCKQLTRLATHAVFSREATIFSEGQRADHVFGIASGLVRLYKQLPDGRRQILGFASRVISWALPSRPRTGSRRRN
ncbi:cyclic nucleotide-binding domain-containing protein [Bradyrhizobium sp.]